MIATRLALRNPPALVLIRVLIVAVLDVAIGVRAKPIWELVKERRVPKASSAATIGGAHQGGRNWQACSGVVNLKATPRNCK